MCGRFVSSSPPDELASYFGAAPPTEVLPGPNYNVAPTSDVYVVVEGGRPEPGGAQGGGAGGAPRGDGAGARRLELFRWGLVPPWADELSVGNRMINARAEGIATKAAFRRPFARRRCIVPADGFFEWAAVPGHRRKQPYFIHRPDGEPYAFAGLWELWRARTRPDDGEDGHAPRWVRSCTIITTGANEAMAPLHDRMPVVLAPAAWGPWLDPANHGTTALARLLLPAPPQLTAYHPVSTEVSNVRNAGAHLLDPVDEIDPDGDGAGRPGDVGQASLFDLGGVGSDTSRGARADGSADGAGTPPGTAR